MRETKSSLINGVPAVTTTEVGLRIGLIVSEALLRKLGVTPLVKANTAVYWRESDMALIRGLLAVFVEIGEAEFVKRYREIK